MVRDMSEMIGTPLREHGFRVLEDDLRYLMEAFAVVLRRMGEPALADRLPWVGKALEPEDKPNRALGQAFSIEN